MFVNIYWDAYPGKEMTCQNMATEAEQISITRKNAVIMDMEIMDIHGCLLP